MADQQVIIPHLFRTEYSKIVSVLCKLFGFAQIEIAEDIVSDTFLTASETWGIKGLPANPTAWLYRVAKNKAKNYLQRDSFFKGRVANEIRKNASHFQEIEIDLSSQNIGDSQLKMMFAICHPSISIESQIGLSLRLLCGFGIGEIADAFLSNKETINKRLFRAKEKLRKENVIIEIPQQQDIDDRLEVVLTTLYLLFSEGYYSVSQKSTLRKEFCLEAIRLCFMLVENKSTNKPAANALLSLMCFHTSRFEARTNPSGELILYEDQDSHLWNMPLIQKGIDFLNRSAKGGKISKYHLEAAIAYWHTIQKDTNEKWENILDLYDQLLQIEYSPMAALNRAYVLSKVRGNQEAIIEAEKLKLTNNQFYFTLLGELHKDIDRKKAKEYFESAYSLAKTPQDRQTIKKKIKHL